MSQFPHLKDELCVPIQVAISTMLLFRTITRELFLWYLPKPDHLDLTKLPWGSGKRIVG